MGGGGGGVEEALTKPYREPYFAKVSPAKHSHQVVIIKSFEMRDNTGRR